MIISASRRTDIPTYYCEWLFNRIKEGFVYVRNPMNVHQISKISLSPDVVDGIVFWTKNPVPMLDKLDELQDYAYYFQFTVNSYGKDIEANIPSKNDVIVPAFRELSRKIGAEKVIWRYDPIMLTSKYTIDYHVNYFNELAKRLSGYTHKCVISFVDFYRNTQTHLKDLDILPLGEKEMYELDQDRIVHINGRLSIRVGEKPIILIEKIEYLDKKPNQTEQQNANVNSQVFGDTKKQEEKIPKVYLKFDINDTRLIDAINEIMSCYQGKSPVFVQHEGKLYNPGYKVNPTNSFVAELADVIGNNNIKIM